MAKNPRSYHGRREMLNRPGFQTTAAIVAEIENTEAGLPRWGEPEYTLQLSDCDRSISFTLDMDTPEGRRNNLHKVDTMIRALTEFRKGLDIEQKRYARRKG